MQRENFLTPLSACFYQSSGITVPVPLTPTYPQHWHGTCGHFSKLNLHWGKHWNVTDLTQCHMWHIKDLKEREVWWYTGDLGSFSPFVLFLFRCFLCVFSGLQCVYVCVFSLSLESLGNLFQSRAKARHGDELIHCAFSAGWEEADWYWLFFCLFHFLSFRIKLSLLSSFFALDKKFCSYFDHQTSIIDLTALLKPWQWHLWFNAQ